MTDPREHPINIDDPNPHLTLYYFRETDFLPRHIIMNAPPADHKCDDCGEFADLLKTFRDIGEGQVGPAWLCADCGDWIPEKVDAWEVGQWRDAT